MTAAVAPASWTMPDGRVVTPQTETLMDFLEYSHHAAGQELKKCPPFSRSYEYWSGVVMAYSLALARCRQSELTSGVGRGVS